MIILDTEVLSELMRPMPAAEVCEWVAKQPSRELTHDLDYRGGNPLGN